MPPRSRAREIVLQLLYQEDLNPAISAADGDRFLRGRLRDPRLQRFASDLLAGLRTKRAQLDQIIAATAENWRLERMTPVDRNILRLGAYELLFTNAPPKAVINEAVELAKRYGTAQSAPFVNGILDRLMAHAEPDSPVPPAPEPPDPPQPNTRAQDPAQPLRS